MQSAFPKYTCKRVPRMAGPLYIYRPVLCAATISVKCVTVEATAKASFDFSLVAINSWFMPLRVEYARSRRVTVQTPSNHAWDRPVAKIGLAATVVCVRFFYFVRYPGDANRQIPSRMSKETIEKPGSRALSRHILLRLYGCSAISLPKIPVKIILISTQRLNAFYFYRP